MRISIPFVIFSMALGSFLTVFVIGAPELSGPHSWAEGAFDAWGMVITGIAVLVFGVMAVWAHYDD